MSTKFVPFTTRPLSTSRQGMTRLSSTRSLLEHVLRLGHREALLVERLPGHDTGEVHQTQLLQRAQVVERADPSRVEKAAPDGLADAPHLVQVGTVQHPVA